jgi:hypothetical protein
LAFYQFQGQAHACNALVVLTNFEARLSSTHGASNLHPKQRLFFVSLIGFLFSCIILFPGYRLTILLEPILVYADAAPRQPPSLFQGDSNWYQEIANDGYQYDVSRRSNVAFFPAYPMTARLLSRGNPSAL